MTVLEEKIMSKIKDEAKAKHIAKYYKAHGIARIDPVNGGFKLAHGCFMDADILEKAATACIACGSVDCDCDSARQKQRRVRKELMGGQ